MMSGGPSSALLSLAVLANLVLGPGCALIVEGPSSAATVSILPNGATCLASNADMTILIAGTKTGGMMVSSRTTSRGRDQQRGAAGGGLPPTTWEEVHSDDYRSKFPVYSIAFAGERDDGDEFVFAGAGDRFVSVWRRREREERGDSSFEFVRTLGPHTGWVKALAYSGDANTLYSIGCNCIESWDVSHVCDDVRHISKRTIENSPSMGSTLSSDLLSLCLLDGICLVSGGVDGRMHCWSLDPTVTKPFFTGRSHDGRVNAIVHHTPLGLIFSVGHDGMLLASKWTTSGGGGMETMAAFEVDGAPRLSALCIVDESPCGCKLGLGSTDGRVVIVRVTASEDDDISIAEECRLEVDGNPMIYSVCKSPARTNGAFGPSILVGHAKDLIEWKYIS